MDATSKHQVVSNSELPIPSHLSEYIGRRRRIWGMMIINYPIKLLVPAINNEHNPRLDPQLQTYKVKEPLKEYGFIGAIPVTPIGTDKKTGMTTYEILNGDVRYFAMIEAKISTVNIQVFEGSEKELAPLRVALNSNPDLKPADLALYFYNELHIKYGYTHDEIARLCTTDTKKIGRTWVTSMCAIAEHAITEVIDAWRDGLIKKTHALNIVQTLKKHNKDQQLKALRAAIAGAKAQDINPATLPSIVNDTVSACKISPVKRRMSDAIKKSNSTKNKDIKLQSKFALISRYERVKNIDTAVGRALVKEYEWILGIDGEED